jgi:sulfur carrier protein
MLTLTIEVNGRTVEVTDGTSVEALVAQWCPSTEGIAVARNREVVPRSAWSATGLRADDRVEIVTAVAGG